MKTGEIWRLKIDPYVKIEIGAYISDIGSVWNGSFECLRNRVVTGYITHPNHNWEPDTETMAAREFDKELEELLHEI